MHQTHPSASRRGRTRAMALLLALALLLGFVPGLDLGGGGSAHWSDAYLSQLIEWDFVRPDQVSQPDKQLTRADFMAITNRAYGYSDQGPTPFEDIKESDWFYDDVEIAYTNKYIKGTSETTASPNDTLTRETAATILGRNMMMQESAGEILDFTDARDISFWSKGVIKSSLEHYLVGGYDDGTFRPQRSVTWGEMAAMLTRIVGTPLQEPGDYSLGGVFGNVTITSPGVTLRDTVVSGDLYITGGVGGTHFGEAFSYPFDLPNDTAYSETCAAIALALFARRMLEIEPRAEYADVMELALYNTVLAGMALDGKSFFYVNPLEVIPAACKRDERLKHVDPVRQKWLGCAYCPPNLARIVSSAAAYAYTENENTLWVHLYMGGELTKKVGETTLRLTLESGFPWEGRTKLTIRTDNPMQCTLAFRLPGWCGTPAVSAPDGTERADRDGYCYLTGTWRDGDTVTLDFPMQTRLVTASNRVRENLGRGAIVRGPITYCLEQADNGPDLHLCRVDPAQVGGAKAVPLEIGGRQMIALELPGLREEPSDGPLYQDYAPAKTSPVTLKFIPYFAWANRGEGEMRVWVRV